MFDRIKHRIWRRHVYRLVYATPEGRAMIHDLLRFCNFRAPVVVPNDPMMTGYNDGMRRVGLRIASFIGMTDEDVMRLSNQPQESIDD